MKSEIETLRKNAEIAGISKPVVSVARQKNIEIQMDQENAINELLQAW